MYCEVQISRTAKLMSLILFVGSIMDRIRILSKKKKKRFNKVRGVQYYKYQSHQWAIFLFFIALSVLLSHRRERVRERKHMDFFLYSIALALSPPLSLSLYLSLLWTIIRKKRVHSLKKESTISLSLCLIMLHTEYVKKTCIFKLNKPLRKY